MNQEDGPIATFVCVQTEEMRKKQEAYLSEVAKSVKPSDRTFEQMLAYFVETYHAVPTVLPKEHRRERKANVILRCFPELLQEDIDTELTPEEKQHYRRRSDSFIRALKYPEEKLDLEFRTFLIPQKPKVKKAKNRNAAAQLTDIDDQSILEVEMKTEYMSAWNVEESILDDLCIWRGVAQRDMDERSPRFIEYAEALKRLNRIKK